MKNWDVKVLCCYKKPACLPERKSKSNGKGESTKVKSEEEATNYFSLSHIKKIKVANRLLWVQLFLGDPRKYYLRSPLIWILESPAERKRKTCKVTD